MKVDYIIPPKIIQSFTKLLLIQPMPKLRDDLDFILRVFQYIELYLSKKLKTTPGEAKKYEQLRKRFLNIYVGQKEKEKDNTSEEKNRTQEFMYYIEMPDSSSRDLLFRLRQRSYKVPSNFRRDDAISEV